MTGPTWRTASATSSRMSWHSSLLPMASWTRILSKDSVRKFRFDLCNNFFTLPVLTELSLNRWPKLVASTVSRSRWRTFTRKCIRFSSKLTFATQRSASSYSTLLRLCRVLRRRLIGPWTGLPARAQTSVSASSLSQLSKEFSSAEASPPSSGWRSAASCQAWHSPMSLSHATKDFTVTLHV